MEKHKYLPLAAILSFAIFVGFMFTRESRLINLLEKYSNKLEDFQIKNSNKQPQKIYKIKSHKIEEKITTTQASSTFSSTTTELSDSESQFIPEYELHKEESESEPESKTPPPPKFTNISLVEQNGLFNRFQRRKTRLVEFCNAWSKEGRVTHKFNNQKIGVAFPEAKLLLCAPWKCGSSFWRQYVVALHKKINGPNWSDSRVRGEDPVYAHLSPEEKRKLLYSPETVSILVVRHPLIRLISAWNEKFHRDYRYGYSMFRREHNLSKYAKEKDETHWVSFPDFARWIAFDDYQLKNKHFRPQSYMCPPCGTRFQYIIKAETMTEDIAAVFNNHTRLFVNDTLWSGSPFHSMKGGFGGKSPVDMAKKARAFYENLERPVLEGLVKVFKMDMLAFGYTFDLKTRSIGGLTV